MKNNAYSERRKELIHQYNINLLNFIVEMFTTEFGQELSHFEKLQVCKKEDNVRTVGDFCLMFYGVSNFEWVEIHFKSGLYVSMTAHAQILEIRYNRNRARTSKINEIRNFLTENRLI